MSGARDADTPAATAARPLVGLILVFQQVDHEAFELMFDGTTVALRQALHLLQQVGHIHGRPVLGPQRLSLGLRPGIEVGLIIDERDAAGRILMFKSHLLLL